MLIFVFQHCGSLLWELQEIQSHKVCVEFSSARNEGGAADLRAVKALRLGR